jgi:DNA-binding response OmpR family regulator
MSREMNFETVPVAELAVKGIRSQTDQPRPIVLVVDDEVVIADTLTAILGRNGMAAMTAYDGESALEIMLTIPPDLLLTDVAMPGMSGIDLAIATRQAIPGCKILLFSGQAATADLLAEARGAGYDFRALEKPIHPTELLARISETLESATGETGNYCMRV